MALEVSVIGLTRQQALVQFTLNFCNSFALKVSTITTDGAVALAIDKEARKLAMKYVKEQRSLKNKSQELNYVECKKVTWR